jgi:hypothetical protein
MRVNDANRSRRVAAIDVRPHWFGYVVFDTPTKLLDFGLTGFASLAGGEIRFTSLVKRFRPSLVVFRRMPITGRRNQPSARVIAKSLKRLSYESSIKIAYVSEKQLRLHFMRREANNKDEIASLIAQLLPELSWKLPPARKTWQHEHKNMPIFDAAALALAHFEFKNNSNLRRQKVLN